MSTPFNIQFPAAFDDARSLGVAANDAAGYLAAPGLAIGGSSFSLTLLSDADEFGESGALTIDNESIYFTRVGNAFTATQRGAQGTTEAAHAAGAIVEDAITAGHHANHSAAIQAVQAKIGNGASTPFAGAFLIGGATPGSSTWRAPVASDIPDLSGIYSVAGHNHAGVYQPLDGDLTAIAALATTSFGRALLTVVDAAAARAAIGAGTSSFDGAFGSLSGLPTTLVGYGITDAQPLDSDLTAIAGLATTSFGRALLTQADGAAVRSYIGAGTSSFSGVFSALTGKPTTLAGYGITDAYPLSGNPSNFLTGNQTVTLSGDVSGSGATTIAATLATVNSNVGSFSNATITVDAKGRVTAAASGLCASIVDTKANILALTRNAGVIAYATDVKQFAISTGGGGWDFGQLSMVAEVPAPDLGGVQNSPRNGYGASFVTDKSIVNSTIGYSGVASSGGLRITQTGKFQIYLNGGWNDIVFNFVLREISANNYALEHAPIGFSNYIEMMTGMSLSALGRNGLPLTVGYKTTIGAYGYPGKVGGRSI